MASSTSLHLFHSAVFSSLRGGMKNLYLSSTLIIRQFPSDSCFRRRNMTMNHSRSSSVRPLPAQWLKYLHWEKMADPSSFTSLMLSIIRSNPLTDRQASSPQVSMKDCPQSISNPSDQHSSGKAISSKTCTFLGRPQPSAQRIRDVSERNSQG